MLKTWVCGKNTKVKKLTPVNRKSKTAYQKQLEKEIKTLHRMMMGRS